MCADSSKDQDFTLNFISHAIGKRDASLPAVSQTFHLLCLQRRVARIIDQKSKDFFDS